MKDWQYSCIEFLMLAHIKLYLIYLGLVFQLQGKYVMKCQTYLSNICLSLFNSLLKENYYKVCKDLKNKVGLSVFVLLMEL